MAARSVPDITFIYLLTVSYTHLDVYKRQPTYTGFPVGTGSENEVGAKSVGTRLFLFFALLPSDVYKRQAYTRVTRPRASYSTRSGRSRGECSAVTCPLWS